MVVVSEEGKKKGEGVVKSVELGCQKLVSLVAVVVVSNQNPSYKRSSMREKSRLVSSMVLGVKPPSSMISK